MQSYSQSPTEPGFVQDPYPFYERTRATGPLFHWKEYGFVCAAELALVNALLRDRRFGREQLPDLAKPVPPHIKPFMDFEAQSLLEREPPAHTRLRGLILRAFTSRRIAALTPEIEALSHRLIDLFPNEPFDLLAAYGERIPVIIIARMLGVPEENADQLLSWSHAMVAMYQANRSRLIEEAAVVATKEFSDYIREQIAHKRQNPADDLITHLIAAEESGDKLSSDELISTCILLLNAGHEATVHSIGNGVKTLLESGQDISILLSPDQIDATVEETIRFDPPLHMFTRYAYEDVNIDGHTFKRGDTVGLLLAAANRDPSGYENAGEFDPTRQKRPNTSFGAGVHFCVGAPLARLELKTALPILFERCPNLCLAKPPKFADRYHFHGLESLMVTR